MGDRVDREWLAKEAVGQAGHVGGHGSKNLLNDAAVTSYGV